MISIIVIILVCNSMAETTVINIGGKVGPTVDI